MSCILFADDEEAQKRINIDDLYQKEQRRDLKQLAIFNKILNRVHRRITTTSRMKRNDKHIWFSVPDFIFGEPLYHKSDCIAFIVAKLEDNGFFIQYIHPNTLFVSWENWVPTYTRNEIKKKTGMVLDEKGNVVRVLQKDDHTDNSAQSLDAGLSTAAANAGSNIKPQKQYTPINQYKPTGNLVYNQDVFEKLEKKVSFS